MFRVPNDEIVLVERGHLGLVVAALAFLLLDLVQGVSEALLALLASVEALSTTPPTSSMVMTKCTPFGSCRACLAGGCGERGRFLLVRNLARTDIGSDCMPDSYQESFDLSTEFPSSLDGTTNM